MSSLQMLPEGQEAPDVNVAWEDQERINQFSKLNSRLSDLEDHYKEKQNQKEYLEDISTEIELIDEDELVQYKIGDSFFWIKQEEAVEKLEKETESTESDIHDLDDKMDSLKDEMNDLKAKLYSKFGNAINLER
ncbi:Prefoldin subunit-domain-containing protein [Dipodascopsis uninucleata]